MQAVYYRGVLADQLAVLAAELTKAQKMLAWRLDQGDLFAIMRTEREIRAKEASYRELDRLISALDRRFGARRLADAATRTLTNSLRARRSRATILASVCV